MYSGCLIESSDQVTEFHNPLYPGLDNISTICALNLKIYDSDVCQVRLDFTNFDLDQPTNGDCLGDKFRVTTSAGTPIGVPTLCGRNDNQHFSILFDTNNDGDYRWHVTATQINCRYEMDIYPYTMPSVAPENCLQYFISPRGQIQSFNYEHAYLNNLDYLICVQRGAHTCRVSYSADHNNFIGIAYTAPDTAKALVGDSACANDYLVIEGGSRDGNLPTRDRYCGNRLHYANGATVAAPVVSKANGPIALRFYSDDHRISGDGPGFRLRYEQSSTDCNAKSPDDSPPPAE
ncbi:unnamed protein product [Medioppia subpectinata]|uniref:CUB domain-containing protein n=1 Tax=Medioppia subpectinata TaxID=1979941 RepID=A0A7R9KU76_9ACAR|nr:unnamed protein product [Medioppia subpectinata]CAG2109819.1 unnamed protein product [Medioppia subpectinata]